MVTKCLSVKQVEFPSSQEAWEGINEIFIKGDSTFFREGYGGILNKGAAYAYNLMINIRKAWMDPEFDFGRLFNYQQTKWTMLLNNYVNMNQLDLMRSQIRDVERKKTKNYNYSFDFVNTHTNGKGCLIAASFCRRLDMDIPIIIANMRSSEITKRLAFDLLLLQRLGEYVYGENETFMLQLNINQMYCNVETLIMYENWKPIRKILKGVEETDWTNNVTKTLKYFKTVDEKEIKYKVYRRTLACLQPGVVSEKKVQTLCARELLLEYDAIEYPEDCISYSQRQKYKRSSKNKSK